MNGGSSFKNVLDKGYSLHCPYKLPPYVEYDVVQEYWDIYRKPIISEPKRKKKASKSKKNNNL